MHIGVLDDEEAQRTLLARYIREWGTERALPLSLGLFANSEEFLTSGEAGHFDLLVLDIEMGALSGMALARRLRDMGDRVPIVFVTGFDEYMAQGYEVEALHYLLKPVQKDKLFQVLDRALTRHEEQEERLLFQTREGSLSLSPSAIWYVEAERHNCLLHAERQEWTLTESFGELGARLLSRPGMLLCRRGVLVNLRYAAAIERGDLILDDGTRLPISRSLLKTVHRAFIDFFVPKREGEP